MADNVPSRLQILSDEIASHLGPEARDLMAQICGIEPSVSGRRGFANLGPVVRPLAVAAALPDLADRRNLSRAVIARLASSAVQTIAAKPVSKDVIARSERWQGDLLAYLEEESQIDYWFPNDLFLKDYRFAAGITIPCGAQVIDLWDGIGPKTALKLGVKHPRLLARALGRPWFQIHTETRYLDEFNDAGWTAFYGTAVDLLRMNPHIQGIVGTSWFYDPALATVSPRLSYLREYPICRGAVSVKQGTTAFDIKSATATSPSRRKLMEEGKYKPTCHTLIWPREAMLAWAATPRSA